MPKIITKDERAGKRIWIPNYIYEYLKDQKRPIHELIKERFPDVAPTPRETKEKLINQLELNLKLTEDYEPE